MSSRWISTSLSMPAFLPSAALTDACVALTSDDLPMPRAPHSSALLAGSARAKRSVFSTRMSRMRSMPLSSDMSTRLTRGTPARCRPSRCQMKASAAAKSVTAAGGGASRSSAAAIARRVAPSGAGARSDFELVDVSLAPLGTGFFAGFFGIAAWNLDPGRSLKGQGDTPQGAPTGRRTSPYVAGCAHCNRPAGRYSPRRIAPQAGARPPKKRSRTRGRGMVMFISPAYAQGLPGAGGNDMLMSLLPFILIFVIMYFLILRPQQKRVKQHQELVKNVRRGDTVITSGGLVGKVTKVVDDDQIEVEIAEGVRVRQVRAMVSDVRAKGEPVKDEAASG